MMQQKGRRHRVLSVLAPSLEKSMTAFDRANVDRAGIQVVIAAERYRIAHGRWPAHLSELVPDFLAAIPIDDFDGAALKYLVTGTGPIVYSAGCDGDDDRGHPPVGVSNDVAAHWFAPQDLARAPDGDYIIWPRPVVPLSPEREDEDAD
jgi:hypothetical protein